MRYYETPRECIDYFREEDRAQFARLSSDEAKRLGQRVDMRTDWDEVKCGIMERSVYAKFTQNPTLAQALLDTGDKPLKEGNYWKDLYWGVDSKTGRGENHLGQILMEIREELRRKGYNDNRNGSLMRILPLAFVPHKKWMCTMFLL